ncbi:polysaccharide deacetylase family protein [Paenibacillus marinisediminis]
MMKDRKKRLEIRLLAVIGMLALCMGTGALFGTIAEWDQVAYASSQQMWNQVNTVTASPYAVRTAATSVGKPNGQAVQLASANSDQVKAISADVGEVEVLAAAAKPKTKTVYLTFDDGPSEHTGDVLDILKKEQVKGTFFVLGTQVKQHNKLMKRIADEGHAIGNHSYDHNYKKLYSDFREFWSQIRKTGQVIKDAVGYEPALVRAPGGTYLNFNKQYFTLMEQAGYKVFDWNVDTGDSKRVGVPAKEIVQTVKSSSLTDSIIVLMHDGAGHGETVKALPEIISYYKSKGYVFEAITSDTKPMHFQLADRERWQRSDVSKAWIEANIVTVDAGGKTKETVAKPDPMRFLVTTDIGELAFEPGQHLTYENTTYVPIRSFVEQLGGTVEYDEANARFTLSINDTKWAIDSKSGQLDQLLDDGTTMKLQWKAAMKDNMFWVPLRLVLEDSGLQLLQYQLIPIPEKPAEKAAS